MSQQRPFVVSLCDLTGVMVRPWAEAGCECVCIDIQHSIRVTESERSAISRGGGWVARGRQVGDRGGSIEYRWGDLRHLTPGGLGDRPDIVFAFPPCTHLAVSGARDFATKGLRLFIDALELVESCRMICEWTGCPWMLENPVGRLSTAWRKPDHTFNPCDYGDPWTKRTCLWTGNGFVMPPKRPVEATEGSRMHLMAPSPDRANQRAATPPGFARAVFEANHPQIVRAVA